MKISLSLTSTLLVSLLACSPLLCVGEDSPPDVLTLEPSPAPTERELTPEPTEQPSKAPTTPEPSRAPITEEPTFRPTEKQTPPTVGPTTRPTLRPTVAPTRRPTAGSAPPTSKSPTLAPTTKTTTEPTSNPTTEPTQEPTMEPTDNPTRRPTQTPSRAPTAKPTNVPTIAFKASSSAPSRATTTAPSMIPTIMPSTVPSQIPSQVVSSAESSVVTQAATNNTTTGTPPSSPTAVAETPSTSTEPPRYDIIADVQSWSNTIDFYVEVSLWSPDGFPAAEDDSELRPFKDAMLTSVRMMYCEDSTTNVCVLRDDMLLLSKEVFVSSEQRQSGNTKQSGNIPSTTLLLPRIAGVKSVGVEPLVWTTWEISFQVVQLGVEYIQELLTQLEDGSDTTVSAEILLPLVPEMIKQKVTEDIKKSIREGTFDGLLHGNLGNDAVVSSVLGEEKDTFQALVVPPSPQTQQSQNSSEEDGAVDLTEIAIYVAIAVGIISMAACAFAYYYNSHINKSSPPEAERQPKAGQRAGAAANKDSTSIVVDSAENSVAYNNSEHEEDDTTTASYCPVIPKGNNAAMEVASMPSPSVDTESDTEGDLSTAVASWQVRPRRFVLQEAESKSQALSQAEKDDDATSEFPTGGSLVAGSVMVGSLGAETVESSLEGWSVNSIDMTWA